MAHAQKPDFVFRRNGRVRLNRRRTSVQSTTGSRGVRISGSNAGYTMFRGSVMSTGYPHHSPVSPSLPLPCVTVCHHNSTGLYLTRYLRSKTQKPVKSKVFGFISLQRHTRNDKILYTCSRFNEVLSTIGYICSHSLVTSIIVYKLYIFFVAFTCLVLSTG